jgi:hypothetical protein
MSLPGRGRGGGAVGFSSRGNDSDPRAADRQRAQREHTRQLLDAAVRPDLHELPMALDPEAPLQVPRLGAGAPLPEQVRRAMERSFHADFGAVRIHEDPHVAALGAEAYTRGADIAFAPGRYQPESAAGLELLGHELAHVVQQAQGRVRPTLQARGLPINDDEGLEREADALGARAASGELGLGSSTLAVAAATPSAPAQGYFRRSLGPNDIHVSDAKNAFIEQDPSPLFSLGETSSASYRNWSVSPLRGVEMLVADDQQMAIQDTSGEPKEFYATREVIERSNSMLETAGSVVGLHIHTDNSILLQRGGSPLNMVRPYLKHSEPDDIPRFAVNCNVLASQITRASMAEYEFVLTDETGENSKRFSVEGNSSAAIRSLADYLSTRSNLPSRKAAKKTITSMIGTKDLEGEAPQIRNINSNAPRLGANENASPEVGEAYATFSHRPPIDWGRKSLNHHWGYHFASVVAKSGEDAITLENYRRETELKHSLLTFLLDQRRELDEEIAKALREVLNEHSGEEQTSRSKLWRELAIKHLLDKETKMCRLFQSMSKQAADVAAQLWFFRMYGSKRKQTFHHIQSKSGSFSNPITLRVREYQRRHRLEVMVLQEAIKELHRNRFASDTEKIYDDLAERLERTEKQFSARMQQAKDDEALASVVRECEQELAELKGLVDGERAEGMAKARAAAEEVKREEATREDEETGKGKGKEIDWKWREKDGD